MAIKVFISYAAADRAIVSQLTRDLSDNGVTVLSDFEINLGITAGQSWTNRLRQQLDSAEAMILAVSTAALESEWVREEWRSFQIQSKRIIPVLIEPTMPALPRDLAEIQIIDLARDYQQGLLRILGALRQLEDSYEPPLADSVDMETLVHRMIESSLKELGITGPTSAARTNEEAAAVDENLVFVVTSFKPDMEPAFEAIKCAADQAGLRAERVKDVTGDYRITEKMIEMIRRAYLIVADLTHERPNVYFELGYARGIGKKVVTILREGTEVHFDVYDWQHLTYIDSRPLEKSLLDRFVYELSVDGRGTRE